MCTVCLLVAWTLVGMVSDLMSSIALQVLHPQTLFALAERCGAVALQRYAFWSYQYTEPNDAVNQLSVCVADDVYSDMKRKARDAILQLIELEREGEQIDRTLLKNILGIFQEVGMGQMTCYQQDFEAQLLKTTAEYYKRKAAVWIEEDSCPDYMVCCMQYVSALTVVTDVPQLPTAYYMEQLPMRSYSMRCLLFTQPDAVCCAQPEEGIPGGYCIL